MQKATKRKGYDERDWSNWQRTGCGGSSASLSGTWRPKSVYTSIDEDNTARFALYSFSVFPFLFLF